jgi:hypothetical protein
MSCNSKLTFRDDNSSPRPLPAPQEHWLFQRLGKDGAVAPSERIVMGCIGRGQIAPGDLGECIKHSEVQFVAVCELDSERLDRARKTVEDHYAAKATSGN